MDTFGSVTLENTGLATLAGLAATGNLLGLLTVSNNAKLATIAPFMRSSASDVGRALVPAMTILVDA